MKINEYREYFEELGVQLSPRVLYRYKKVLYHLAITEHYLESRLDEGVDWWIKSIEGSQAAKKMTDARTPISEIVEAAKLDLRSAISPSDKSECINLLAMWLDGWLNESGLSKIRNSLNTRLSSLSEADGEKTVRLPIMASTRDALVEVIEQSSPSNNYDQMLNQVISFYAHMHDIDLDNED